MTTGEKVEMCQNMIDDVSITTSQIASYLDLSKQRIIDRLYPTGTSDHTIPKRYEMLQCELAVRMIARRGGEGEISHSENGVSRTYGSTDDMDLLQRIVPVVGVL